MDSRFRGNDKVGIGLLSSGLTRSPLSPVIFGLDPEIQEERSQYITRISVSNGLCAALTRSLRSGPPVGVAFGPHFHGNTGQE